MGGITLPTPSTPGYTTFTDYRGRKWTACKCLAQWLGLLQKVAIKRGHIKSGLDVWQLTGGATASAGTHSQGGAFDLLYQTGREFVEMCREFGADATWKRTVAQGFSKDHTHGVLVGCEHNSPARYQVQAQRDGYNGLGVNGHAGPDNYPDPDPRRTWKQGVTEMQRELGLLAVTTTTTLGNYPSVTHHGDAVSLTATVAPSTAKGRVDFQWSTDNGKTWNTFGSAAVANGRAKFTATPGGEQHYRAVFKPTDPLAFLTSNGTALQRVVDLADMRADIDRLEASLALVDQRISALEAKPQT